MLAWITDFLLNHSQCVKLASSFSRLMSVLSGVPQGSVLGPTLFLFVNDVSDIFISLAVSLKLYADDIKLCSCYHVTSTCENDLSVAINRLCEWSDTWLLSIAAHHKCLHVISAVIGGLSKTWVLWLITILNFISTYPWLTVRLHSGQG